MSDEVGSANSDIGIENDLPGVSNSVFVSGTAIWVVERREAGYPEFSSTRIPRGASKLEELACGE
jgi:hypothetical protein